MEIVICVGLLIDGKVMNKVFVEPGPVGVGTAGGDVARWAKVSGSSAERAMYDAAGAKYGVVEAMDGRVGTECGGGLLPGRATVSREVYDVGVVWEGDVWDQEIGVDVDVHGTEVGDREVWSNVVGESEVDPFPGGTVLVRGSDVGGREVSSKVVYCGYGSKSASRAYKAKSVSAP